MFAAYAERRFGVPDRGRAWVKTTPVDQDLLVRQAPERFFVPPYVGPKGWVGVFIDSPYTDWEELKALIWDAWTRSVPRRLRGLARQLGLDHGQDLPGGLHQPLLLPELISHQQPEQIHRGPLTGRQRATIRDREH